jgi:hypothetical protein
MRIAGFISQYLGYNYNDIHQMGCSGHAEKDPTLYSDALKS